MWPLSFVPAFEKERIEGRFQPPTAIRWERGLKTGDSFFHHFGMGASEPLDHRQVELKPVQVLGFLSTIVNVENVGLLQQFRWVLDPRVMIYSDITLDYMFWRPF